MVRMGRKIRGIEEVIQNKKKVRGASRVEKVQWDDVGVKFYGRGT